MTACYLDGCFFNKALSHHPGLVRNPMYITMTEDRNGSDFGVKHSNVKMEYSLLSQTHINFIRAVIQTQFIRHSTLLILDPIQKKCWWWNPMKAPGAQAKHALNLSAVAKTLINEYLQLHDNITLAEIDTPINEQDIEGCEVSGHCTAFIIKFAEDVIAGKEFDPDFDVVSYSKDLRERYSNVELPPEADVSHGMGDGSGGTFIGALGGAALGGAIGGTGGALGGALLGGVLGSQMGRHSHHHEHFYDPVPFYGDHYHRGVHDEHWYDSHFHDKSENVEKARWKAPRRFSVKDHSAAEARRI